MLPVNVLVEGPTDEPVAKKLLEHVGLEVGTIYGRILLYINGSHLKGKSILKVYADV